MIILMVGLMGCNLPSPGTNETSPSPTNEAPIIIPTEGTTQQTGSTLFDTASIVTSSIFLEGVAYTANQAPGDPFRFVCQEPCTLDLTYIYAAYAGFRLGHARLIELTGIDTLPQLQPVDMHLDLNDSICSELPVGHAYTYSDTHQAYTCTEGPGYYPTLEEKIQMASLLDGQYFPLHEYMHTLFFGRISGKAGDFTAGTAYFLHDYVVPIPSYAIGILDAASFCSYRNMYPPGDYGGWLISELCLQNGFELPDLALSLVELDRLYQSSGGEDYQEGYQHPVPTAAQYRDILNNLLGSDTTSAFATACWPPELFGSGYSLPSSCPNASTGGTPTPLK